MHEPTGEPESLHGKIDPRRTFGDRAYRRRPAELDGSPRRRMNANRWLPNLFPRARKEDDFKKRASCLLPLTTKGFTTPRLRRQGLHEAMLSVIQQQLGGQPLNIVGGAADEILAVLKNETTRNPDKKEQIEKLLNPIPSPIFDQMVSIGGLITDYQDGGDAAGAAATNPNDALDDDVAVAV
ncbi:hypothetical protein LguiA_015810 [Lonicera macranthoides]